MVKQFVIRVYAIITNEFNEVLISDEYQLNTRMTKFPGGGMEFGEGPIDCIKREAIEEFGQEIEIIDHFYTTDYFQPALFFDDAQLISIYFRAKFKDPIKFKISDTSFDFDNDINGTISFRWLPIKQASEEELTFPIDRIVLNKLKKCSDNS